LGLWQVPGGGIAPSGTLLVRMLHQKLVVVPESRCARMIGSVRAPRKKFLLGL
jgi:hypothetical protein